MKDGSASNGSERGGDPRLTAYALDELPAEARAELERELATSPALADEVRALEQLAVETPLASVAPGGAAAAR